MKGHVDFAWQTRFLPSIIGRRQGPRAGAGVAAKGGIHG